MDQKAAGGVHVEACASPRSAASRGDRAAEQIGLAGGRMNVNFPQRHGGVSLLQAARPGRSRRPLPGPREATPALSQNRPEPSRYGPRWRARFAATIRRRPPRSAWCRASPLPVSGSNSSGVAAARAEATRCGRWLVRGEGRVVLVGRHLHHSAAERLPKRIDFLPRLPDRSRAVGVTIDHAVLEQVGPGALAARFLAARQRMAADRTATDFWSVSPVPASASRDNLALRAADIGDDPPGHRPGGLGGVLGHRFHGRADDDQLRSRHTLAKLVVVLFTHRRLAPWPAKPCADRCRRPFRQLPLAQGQANRPADQAHANDRHGVPALHDVVSVEVGGF